MKSKHLIFTAGLFIFFSFSNAQTPEFVIGKVTYLAVSNGKIFLNAGDYEAKTQGLWISDGTTAGTKLLKELRRSFTPYYTECNGKTYFIIKDAENYSELWTSDGTASGTFLVKKFNPSSNYPIKIMAAYNNKLYFIGYDTEHGNELWVTDGTESGTKLLKDINPGVGNSLEFVYTIVYKNKIYFNAQDKQGNDELWTCDGTEAGTKLFKDINPNGSSHPSRFNVINDKLYFGATTEAEGDELWISDSTEAGTHLVKDITPQGEPGSPRIPFEYDGKVYFLNNRNNKGSQLWTTDGTESGTTFIEDSLAFSTTVFNGELYYSKIVGGKNPYYKYALYKSKGKPGSGILVKVISGGNSEDDPGNFVQANGKLYFTCNYDKSGANYLNNDLWETDGTAANTKLVEITPGTLVDAYRVNGLTEYNNALFFVMDRWEGEVSGLSLYRIGKLNTAITEVNNDVAEMELFPNPTKHQLILKTDEKLIGSNYTVLNITGQTVLSGKINSDNTLIEVGSLPSGTYLVKIQSTNGSFTSRFIKE